MKKNELDIAVIPFENLVLFPSACVPLYIFDPIYIKLIDDCIKNSRKVALALSDPIIDQAGKTQPGVLKPRKITGFGEVILLKEYPDQSKYVLLKGEGKAELKEPTQTYPYLICKSKILETNDNASKNLSNSFEPKKMLRLREILNYWINQNFPDEKQKEFLRKDLQTSESVLDYLSTFLIQDKDIKQILLENGSIQEKIQLISLLFHHKNPVNEDHFTAEIIKSLEFTDSTVGNYC